MQSKITGGGKKLPGQYSCSSCWLNVTLLSPTLFDVKYAAGQRDNFKGQKRKEMARKQEISVIIYSQFGLFSTTL